MEVMNCPWCRFLTLSEDAEEHIIERHFRFRDWRDATSYWHSFFLRDAIYPQQLFHDVQMRSRFSFRQGGWSTPDRFVYYLSFPFYFGFYPLHHGRNYTTNVKIICQRVQCPACGLDQPTKIVTIYPVYW